MPTNTVKLAIPLPNGNETATRQSGILNTFDKVDEQAQQEQFLVRQGRVNAAGTTINDVLFNSGPNTITISIGAGRKRWGSTRRAFAASLITINTPAISTTYYISAKSDGTFVVDTTGAITAGQELLWSVATGNPVAQGTLVVTDLRGDGGNSDAYALAGDVTGTPTATVIATGAVTNGKLGTGAVDTVKAADELALWRDWLGF